MGAGKTTIGRQIADALKLDYYDSDHEIEARSGVDIGWIFDVEGDFSFGLFVWYSPLTHTVTITTSRASLGMWLDAQAATTPDRWTIR